jgi:hypothetical protein
LNQVVAQEEEEEEEEEEEKCTGDTKLQARMT